MQVTYTLQSSLRSTHHDRSMHRDVSTLRLDKLVTIWNDLVPLTAVFQDREGNRLRLWKTTQYGLIGSVMDAQGNLQIVSGDRILNPLMKEQNSIDLMYRLQSSPNLDWELVYDTQKTALTIWPHLRAAGFDDDVRSTPP